MIKRIFSSIFGPSGEDDDDVSNAEMKEIDAREPVDRHSAPTVESERNKGERVRVREWRRRNSGGPGKRVDIHDEEYVKDVPPDPEREGRDRDEKEDRNDGERRPRQDSGRKPRTDPVDKPRERRERSGARREGQRGGERRGDRTRPREGDRREGTLHDAETKSGDGEEWSPGSEKPRRRGPSSDRSSSERRPERRRRDESGTRAVAKAAPEPVVVPELREVEVCEGKSRFLDFEIAPKVLAGVQELGFEYCTPIQAEVFPHVLLGKDLTGKAQTGTGKTAAFLVSALTHMLKNPRRSSQAGTCRALVIAPTRELAIQIHKDAEDISKFCGMRNHVVYGGMGHADQRDFLSEPVDILVGTPGRLLDYSRSRHLNLGHTEILVIDEADRMLDMGFIPDVKRIIGQLPGEKDRQTLLFSATFTKAVIELAKRWQVDPVQLDVEPERLVTDLIDQHFYMVQVNEKIACLVWILKTDTPGRTLIFCNRKDTTMLVSRRLKENGCDCAVLSGDVAQQKRVKILEAFREGTLKVVVATDVAARGIHVDDISLVVNYDLPYESEDYVHRIGRTGRAGNRGKAVGFVCEYGAYMVPELEASLDTKIACSTPPDEALFLPERAPVELTRRRRRPRNPGEERKRRPKPPEDDPAGASQSDVEN